MFGVLAGVLNMGNIDIQMNDDHEAVVASGPGTVIRAVSVSFSPQSIKHYCRDLIDFPFVTLIYS